MQVKTAESAYRKALKHSLERIAFDRSSGETFPFEELFYPLEIDQGVYAFQSYAQQIDRARQASKPHRSIAGRADSVSAQAAALKEKIAASLSHIAPAAPGEGARPQRRKAFRGHSEQAANLEDATKLPPAVKKAFAMQDATNDAGALAVPGDAQIPTGPGGDPGALAFERQYGPGSLVIGQNLRDSRVLAVASAGHGKTTLLKRIALFYCHPGSQSAHHLALKKKYSLSGDFIPCLIRLRDVAGQSGSVDGAIAASVASVFRNAGAGGPAEAPLGEADIQTWLCAAQGRLLLLIDGLDELSDDVRHGFLQALDDYLLRHPRTPVIMTSRAAGLTEPKVFDLLRKMQFRGRSIIPLDEAARRSYAERWIDVTQPAEQRGALRAAVEQIFRQKKFQYLEEFMSTPLELLLILKQIANDSFSLNRFQMFRDTLWEYFTNHVKQYDQKRFVFEDTMTLLGFIAYQMQRSDSMFLSVRELERLEAELGHLSFHTDLIKPGAAQGYREFLDSLAANVGIIERADRARDAAYTFPIRAYQEFLAAHACCHLRLNAELSRPDPRGVLLAHLHDSRWAGVIHFALSDLEANNQREFDALLGYIFGHVRDAEQLRAVVEADLAVTREHALVLCEQVFSDPALTEERKELLIACMNTKSAYAYASALRTLYQAHGADGRYLEAHALASMIGEYGAGHSAFQKALACLHSGAAAQQKLGAQMISLMARARMGEVSAVYEEAAGADFAVSEELLSALAANAKTQRDACSVIALTNCWLSGAAGSERVRALLDAGLASVVLEELGRSLPAVRALCLSGREAFQAPAYMRIRELVFALGSIPYGPRTKSLAEHGRGDDFLAGLLQAMYQASKTDLELDQVALATACLYYCWDFDRFLEAWTFDICDGVPSQYIRKALCKSRERNHFMLVREGLADLEQACRSAHEERFNRLVPDSVFSLFRAGDLRGAANYCIRTMGSEAASNRTNLAFLIRYGHLNPEDLQPPGEYSVPALLTQGLAEQDSYALLNMALYELARGRYAPAQALFAQIPAGGWHNVCKNFWYPELWARSGDPEGALVCVLAAAYGGCEFAEEKEMRDAVKRHYKDVPKEVLKID